jgi:hypothetical protein
LLSTHDRLAAHLELEEEEEEEEEEEDGDDDDDDSCSRVPILFLQEDLEAGLSPSLQDLQTSL